MPTEQAENKPTTSRRDKLLERLRSKYPDRNYDDEDELYGAIGDEYDEMDGRLGSMEKDHKELTELFTKDPRSAHFLTNWAKGGDPAIEFVRAFGMDIRDMLDDPDKIEELAAANKDRLERVARNSELERQYEQNIARSLEMFDRERDNRGMSQDDIDKAIGLLLQIVEDGIIGKFSTESLDMAIKAVYHDRDVENASHEAEVRGRNENIEMKLRKPEQGDGMPSIAGMNGASPSQRRRRSIFDDAADAQ